MILIPLGLLAPAGRGGRGSLPPRGWGHSRSAGPGLGDLIAPVQLPNMPRPQDSLHRTLSLVSLLSNERYIQ